MLINESAEQYLKRVAIEEYYRIQQEANTKLNEQKTGLYESNPNVNTPNWIAEWKRQEILKSANRLGFNNQINS